MKQPPSGGSSSARHLFTNVDHLTIAPIAALFAFIRVIAQPEEGSRGRHLTTLLHATVQFVIGDIIHPYPAQVLCQLYKQQPLQGEVIAVTDDGCHPDGFLVVRIRGLSEPVIVPAEKASFEAAAEDKGAEE